MKKQISSTFYKHQFNMALHAVFEKAVDPAVKTDPPVCLLSEPFEVYVDTNV